MAPAGSAHFGQRCLGAQPSRPPPGANQRSTNDLATTGGRPRPTSQPAAKDARRGRERGCDQVGASVLVSLRPVGQPAGAARPGAHALRRGRALGRRRGRPRERRRQRLAGRLPQRRDRRRQRVEQRLVARRGLAALLDALLRGRQRARQRRDSVRRPARRRPRPARRRAVANSVPQVDGALRASSAAAALQRAGGVQRLELGQQRLERVRRRSSSSRRGRRRRPRASSRFSSSRRPRSTAVGDRARATAVSGSSLDEERRLGRRVDERASARRRGAAAMTEAPAISSDVAYSPTQTRWTRIPRSSSSSWTRR